jgi:anti-anti-sigma factor
MTARPLVLSPQEALVAGGSAERFEQRVQTLYEEGHHNLICDLGEVWNLDSRGIRALVRGHTTAQRLGGSFRIANPHAQVRSILGLSGLDRVLGIFDSVADARRRVWPWKRIGIIAAVVTLGVALVMSDADWQTSSFDLSFQEGQLPEATAVRYSRNPLDPLLRLLVAAAIGLLITAVHRPYVSDRPMGRSMQQAQILLAIAGAMIMIIIGNNVARAFGIAGAASIIRFRTPVEDPKDVTILFLLMALGMSAGLGFYAVAGLGTAFLCLFLLALDRVGGQKARSTMRLDVLAEGKEFPTAYVQNIFVRNRMAFETKEVALGDKVKVRYHVSIPAAAALEDLSAQLMGDGRNGVKGVSWEPVKERE